MPEGLRGGSAVTKAARRFFCRPFADKRRTQSRHSLSVLKELNECDEIRDV